MVDVACTSAISNRAIYGSLLFCCVKCHQIVVLLDLQPTKHSFCLLQNGLRLLAWSELWNLFLEDFRCSVHQKLHLQCAQTSQLQHNPWTPPTSSLAPRTPWHLPHCCWRAVLPGGLSFSAFSIVNETSLACFLVADLLSLEVHWVLQCTST